MPTTGKTRQLTVVDGNFKTCQVYKHLLVAQTEKHLPATWETQVQSLGWEDPQEESMATHSSVLAWKIHGHRSLVSYSLQGHKESDN